MWDNIESDDVSDGFSDLIDRAQVMAWLLLVGFVGFAAWVLL